MIVWFETNPDGTVSKAGRTPELPAGATQAPQDIPPAVLVTCHVLPGGDLAPRPPSPEIATSGTEHTIADCLPGTVIDIDDEISGERLGSITTDQDPQTEVINLPDPGTYSITVRGPLPMLPNVARLVT
ncbi:MAG: hypothetical protein AAF317_13820 [Pseudomonadota bacterium]